MGGYYGEYGTTLQVGIGRGYYGEYGRFIVTFNVNEKYIVWQWKHSLTVDDEVAAHAPAQ